MSIARLNLPKELLEDLGEHKAALREIDRELSAIERRIAAALKKGQQVDDQDRTRARSLHSERSRLSGLIEQRKDDADVARNSAVNRVWQLMNTHNPHNRIGRMLHTGATPADFERLGDMLRDKSKTMLAAGSTVGPKLARLGVSISSGAVMTAATASIAGAVVKKILGEITENYQGQIAAHNAESADQSQFNDLLLNNRFSSRLSTANLLQLYSQREEARRETKEAASRASLTARLANTRLGQRLGLEDHAGTAQGARSAEIAQRKWQARRHFGQKVFDSNSSADEVQRQIDESGGRFWRSGPAAYAHHLWMQLSSGGEYDKNERRRLAEEHQLKQIEAAYQKRVEAMRLHQLDPYKRADDMISALQRHTVAEYDLKRYSDWNKY